MMKNFLLLCCFTLRTKPSDVSKNPCKEGRVGSRGPNVDGKCRFDAGGKHGFSY